MHKKGSFCETGSHRICFLVSVPAPSLSNWISRSWHPPLRIRGSHPLWWLPTPTSIVGLGDAPGKEGGDEAEMGSVVWLEVTAVALTCSPPTNHGSVRSPRG